MTGEIFDLVARRAARRRDAVTIAGELRDAAQSLQARFASWPRIYLNTGHLEQAERELVAMQAALIELRGHVEEGNAG